MDRNGGSPSACPDGSTPHRRSWTGAPSWAATAARSVARACWRENRRIQEGPRDRRYGYFIYDRGIPKLPREGEVEGGEGGEGGHTGVRDLVTAVEVEGGELRAPLGQGGHTGVRDFVTAAEVEGGELRAPFGQGGHCLLYTSPSPRDATLSRMPSSA